MPEQPHDQAEHLRGLKLKIRALAEASRQQQTNRDELSERICQRVIQLPEYVHAKAMLVYVSRPAEVQTRPIIHRAWAEGKQIAVPYCARNELELYCVDSMRDVAPGTLGILEPHDDVRSCAERAVDIGQIDLVVVPGVAFDPGGGRLGHGRGYYDRLLQRAPHETPLVGLAFESQIVSEVPMMEHDVFVHKVITEKAVYLRTEA